MRLSIISTSLIILSTVFTSVRADDSYDEAMDMFCGGKYFFISAFIFKKKSPLGIHI